MSTKKFEFTQGIDRGLAVYEDRVEITQKGGLFGVLSGQGNETLFYKDMTSIEVRECSFVNGGHIKFSVPGTREENNEITFGGFSNRSGMNDSANEIKKYVLQRISESKSANLSSGNSSSTADEIMKLNQMKNDGLLTDEEFQMAKKKALGL